MAALRAKKFVILGAHEWVSWNQAAHRINPEKLPLERDFVDTCHVGQGKSRPAESQGAGTTLASFFDEFCEFLSRDWNSNELSRTEKTKIAQYVTMLIIDAREVFLQDKFGFVSEHLLSARLDVLKLGIKQNPTSKSVWASYRKLVDPDFAEYFEQEIYPGGIDEGLVINHPQYKPAKD